MKTGAQAVQVRDFDLIDLEVKADGDGYRLSGYGSVFGTEDSYGDVVAKGAFAKSIADRKSTGRKLPMLWQHRSSSPIGVWDEVKEDAKGLYMAGPLIKGVQLAEEARLLAQAGAVTGLSIGYYVRDSSFDQKTFVTTLKEVELIETSLVTFPANDDARVDAVKFMLAEGSLPPLKDFERLLRSEFGLSKTAATLVITKGYGELLRRESGGKDEPKAPAPVSPDVRQAIAALRQAVARP